MKLATLPDSVQSLFDAMIAELTNAYTAQGSGITVPVNQFIAPGIIAWDDEFAAIQLQDIDAGAPGSPAGPPPPVPIPLTFYGVWAFTILRHVHIGQDGQARGPIIPTPAEINTDGVQAMADASALTIASIAVWMLPSVPFLKPTGIESPLAISRWVCDSVVLAPIAAQLMSSAVY